MLYFLWLLAGLSLMALSLPLIYQKVPPNHWYGFRVRKTLTDRRIWYAANRAAGLDLFLAGTLIALTALLTALLSWVFPAPWLASINFSVFVLSLSASVLHSFWVLAKL